MSGRALRKRGHGWWPLHERSAVSSVALGVTVKSTRTNSLCWRVPSMGLMLMMVLVVHSRGSGMGTRVLGHPAVRRWSEALIAAVRNWYIVVPHSWHARGIALPWVERSSLRICAGAGARAASAERRDKGLRLCGKAFLILRWPVSHCSKLQSKKEVR